MFLVLLNGVVSDLMSHILQPFAPFAVVYCLLEFIVASYESGSMRLLVLS